MQLIIFIATWLRLQRLEKNQKKSKETDKFVVPVMFSEINPQSYCKCLTSKSFLQTDFIKKKHLTKAVSDTLYNWQDGP